MTLRPLASRMAVLILGCTTAVPTFAEPAVTDTEPSANPDKLLEHIIVLGDKRGRTLADTAASVRLYTGAELEDSTTQDLYDLVLRTPNVSESFGQKGFSIRGIDQRGFGAGSGLLLTVQVDNAALPNNQATFFGPYATWDLGQVEVFRGSVGTKQGRNALAGAIIMRSADPVHEWQAKARGGYASFDTHQLSAAVNAPVIDDKIAVRISADWRESDGWVENPTLGIDDYDRRDALTLRGKVLIEPWSQTRIILSASNADNQGGEDAVEEASFPDRINRSDLRAHEGSKHRIYGLEIVQDIADGVSITSITTGYGQDYSRLEDADQGEDPNNVLTRDQQDWAISQEVRMNFEFGPVSGVFGSFYTKIDTDLTDFLAGPLSLVVPGIPDQVRVSRSGTLRDDTQNWAIFGELDVALGHFVLTAGARYDQENQDFFRHDQTNVVDPLNILTIPIPLPGLGQSTTISDITYDAFLPKFAIRYNWSDSTNTSLTVQRGYRAGGNSTALISGEQSQYDPEYTWTYELALRTQFAFASLNANIFYIDWTDQQVSVPTDTGGAASSFDTVTVNAGKSELYGIEFDVDMTLTDSLTGYVSLGYVHGKFREFVSGGNDLSGNRFPHAPDLSTSAGLTWRLFDRFSIRGDLSYQTRFFSDAANSKEFEVESRFLVDVKLGYQAAHWSAFVYAKNLLDNDYRIGRFSFNGEFARTGPPRIVGIELNSTW